MRKSRFTDEQIIAILQESAALAKTGEVLRRHGISRETFYKWRRKYGGLKMDDAKRLRGLEEENRRLKRVVARPGAQHSGPEGPLGKRVVTSEHRRTAVTHASETAADHLELERRVRSLEVRLNDAAQALGQPRDGSGAS